MLQLYTQLLQLYIQFYIYKSDNLNIKRFIMQIVSGLVQIRKIITKYLIYT